MTREAILYSQRPKLIPQRQEFHRNTMHVRVYTKIHFANSCVFVSYEVYSNKALFFNISKLNVMHASIASEL